jgi:hypothetical protein
MNRFFPAIATLAVLAAPVGAQSRRANVGNGNPESGKCTIEVVVDGAAEVDIMGDNATLRNLSGQPPQWRRFECTSRMPANPNGFQFRGIDGRGRVDLVASPRNGGAAVVRIEDSDGGAEGYTFDIMWGRGYTSGGPGGFDRPGGIDRPGPGPAGNPGWWTGGGIWGSGQRATNEAIRVCRDDVRGRASQQLGPGNVRFRDTRLQDQPGRRDWVMGSFTHRGRPHEFACSVDFATGRIRWAQIDAQGGRWGDNTSADRFDTRAAVENCREQVAMRMRNRGLGNIDFSRINIDNNPGRNDWVIGNVQGTGRRGSELYNFSCQVNMGNGNLRSVDLQRR